jgi:tetratricopeptide (TPR) repeat protein
VASKFSLFLAELKRRGCVRTAGLYAISAWAVIEVSATVMPYLLLPDWLVTLVVVLALVGFPISVVFSWFFDLIPESVGNQRASPGEEAPEKKRAQPDRRWHRLLPASLTSIPVVLAGIGFFFFFFVPSVAESFQERDWLLVTEFLNETGYSAFDGSIRAALTTSLRQSGFVNTVSMERVSDAIREEGFNQPKDLTEQDWLQVAENLEARAILVGRIEQKNDGYGVSARLLDAGTGNPIRRSLSIRAPLKENVLVALDLLAQAIRRGLGESPGEVEVGSLDLPMITTASLEALRDYVAAHETESYEETISLLELALEKDSAFALAHAQLGMNHYIHNNRPDGDRHFDAALSLRDRLTERERLYIAALAQEFRGDYEGAVVSHRVYLRKYVDDATVWFRLGYALFLANQCEEAIEAFENYLRLDHDEPNAYVNIATCQDQLGDVEPAIDSYRRAFDLSPDLRTDWNINGEYGFLLLSAGEPDSARAHFGLMLEESRGKRARAHRSLGLLSMYEGNYREASAFFKEAAEYDRVSGFELSEVRDLGFLASSSDRLDDSDSLREAFNRIWELLPRTYIEPFFLAVVGQRFAQKGMLDRARETLSLLEGRVNEGSLSDAAAENLLRGEIALAEGNPNAAISTLSLAAKQRPDALHIEPLARAYRLSGQTTESIRYYWQTVEDMSHVGWESQEAWVSAHYWLARLYEEADDVERAVQHYRTLTDLWTRSGGAFTLRRDVETRLEGLLSATRRSR